MDAHTLNQLKESLQSEERDLVDQLKGLGVENPDGEYTAKIEDLGRTEEDTRTEDELFEEAQPLINELLEKLRKIRESLKKITDSSHS